MKHELIILVTIIINLTLASPEFVAFGMFGTKVNEKIVPNNRVAIASDIIMINKILAQFFLLSNPIEAISFTTERTNENNMTRCGCVKKKPAIDGIVPFAICSRIDSATSLFCNITD